jgi:hypothetical protein
MSDIQPGTTAQSHFFSQKNEVMLDRLLYNDFQRRIGSELNERQKQRLDKTVKHYMTEVYSKHPTQPVQYLNREVLVAVVPDYMAYLRRNSAATLEMEENGGNTELRMDVNSRFEQLQAERQALAAGGGAATGRPPPAAPDFRIPLDESGPTPLSRFEQIKRQREIELQRDAETAAAMAASRKGPPDFSTAIVPSASAVEGSAGLGRFIDADVDFRNANEQARQREQLTLLMREAERNMSKELARNEIMSGPAPEIPDPRRILLGEGVTQLPAGPRGLGIAGANPTLALPDGIRSKPVLPQDVLTPNDDIITYKETEHNLYVYSADRDWVANNAENRYNFSVTFDPANNRPGFGYSPATNIRFKNITRIEFVKAIMPVEACDILPSYNGSGTLITDINPNIFAYPYLQVRIPELNTNGYGTNDGMNNAFAAISYDAYWTADTTAKTKGYTRMIPKFLKCQKVYQPTPLATLNKLTFEIQRPDGSLVCQSKDTLDIGALYMPTADGTGSSSYVSGSYNWLWLNTSTFFNKFLVSQGDRIVIKNVELNATLAAVAGAGSLVTYLTRPEGHLVSDIGYTDGTNFTTGANAVGYANGIILPSEFQDPTTGATTVKSWVSAIGSSVNSNPTLTTGRLLNLNKQIQIILRVITRDMDATGKLRPDNLQA